MEVDKITAFGMKMDFECYCGKKITIEYDEDNGIKKTKCKYCGYNHSDLVYSWRKDAELHTDDFLKLFFK